MKLAYHHDMGSNQGGGVEKMTIRLFLHWRISGEMLSRDFLQGATPTSVSVRSEAKQSLSLLYTSSNRGAAVALGAYHTHVYLVMVFLRQVI